MLPFRLQVDSGVPAYRQVMEQVRYFLAAGLVREGGQVPSIRELARHLAVNPGTIVRAYSELEHAGVIESRHGRGYFIAAGPVRLSRAERETAVREQARRLWVAVRQAGLSDERAERIIAHEREALAALNSSTALTP
jgi:GntR family transcriptional regulator